MKKVLIISPYFPPSNAADLHRIRMSLPYFEDFGWTPEVVTVNSKHYEGLKDERLMHSVPKRIKVHRIEALSVKYTRKLGLGSLAIRSLWFYKKKVNQLLKVGKFDLIYFSTTQFPVCTLGRYWKNKFGVPYVIDMQDPWHTEYYKNKPKHERPAKFWFSYRLNQWLEPLAINNVDGLIAVSENYINDLQLRYPRLINVPNSVITFGYSTIDKEIADQTNLVKRSNSQLQLAYVGVLGQMMKLSLSKFFGAATKVEKFSETFNLQFNGTSYQSGATEKKAVKISENFGTFDIDENPERIGMTDVIITLQNSNGLLIFGTDDIGYTASKIYPYIQSKKPIFAILHKQSSAFEILENITSAIVVSLSASDDEVLTKLEQFLTQVKENKKLEINMQEFELFSARALTKKQIDLFEQVIKKNDF